MEAIKRLRVTSPYRVQSTLRSLPRTLDETYDRILNGLERQGEAFTALQWLTFSTRPLKTCELAEACIVDPDAEKQIDEQKRFPFEQLFDLRPSLVTVTEVKGSSEMEVTDFMKRRYSSTLSVRLAHFSVKEYLISERIRTGHAADFSLQAGLANSFIAKSCVA